MNAAAIARALGRPKKAGRTWMAVCPCHADRTASLAIRDAEVGVLVHCHAGCKNADVIDELTRRGLWDRDPRSAPPTRTPLPVAHKDDEAARITYARDIWNAAVDPRHTLADEYLNKRGLGLPDELCNRVVKFHPQCPFGKDEAGERRIVPAMLLAFQPMRGHDEPLRAIHRVGLNRDGTKIGKMMLGPVGGCAIKLDHDDAVTDGLGIAEGFETALAIYLYEQWHPIWALGSVSRIKTFEPIPEIEALTIWTDNDVNDVGIRDARECANRWRKAKREIWIKRAPTRGTDWADEYTSTRAR